MGLIDCSKCGEKVDEAKAFCPACGAPMVEERERTSSTSYDEADMTMHLGQTMYNQMLSDMGLNKSKPPDADKSRTIQPLPEAQPRPVAPASIVPAKKSNRKIWIITAAIAAVLILLFVALLIVGLAGGVFYMSKPGG